MQRVNQLQKNTALSKMPVAALPATLLLLLFLALGPSAHSASVSALPASGFPAEYAQLALDEFANVKEIEDLLEERRFRVEIILFTRVDQSGFGEEPLLSIAPRVLPNNMFGLTPSIGAAFEFNRAPNNFCIGYPNIAIEPELPAKLRALLNKENEPELAQWFNEDNLGTNSQALNPQLGENSFLFSDALDSEAPRADLIIGSDFTNSDIADEAFAEENLRLQTASPREQFIELVTPAIAPRVSPTPYLNFITQLSLFEDALKENSFGAIAPERFELSKEASTLDQNPKFNLLLHQSWQQVVPPRAAPQQIYFTAKASATSLEGLISVTLGRYLHFAGQLWLEAPVADYEAEQLLSVGDGTIANLHSSSTQKLLNTESVEATTTQKNASSLAALEKANSPKTAYFELNESRRMRSKELHYLDHPAMGIIVKITPVEASELLRQAWTDFDKYRQPNKETP